MLQNELWVQLVSFVIACRTLHISDLQVRRFLPKTAALVRCLEIISTFMIWHRRLRMEQHALFIMKAVSLSSILMKRLWRWLIQSMTLWLPMRMRKSSKRVSVSLDKWKLYLVTTIPSILLFAIFLTITKITVKTCWQVRQWLLRIPALSLWKFTSVFWNSALLGRKRLQL